MFTLPRKAFNTPATRAFVTTPTTPEHLIWACSPTAKPLSYGRPHQPAFPIMLAIQILAWLILAYLALCLSILLAGGIIMAIGAILSGILSIFATADDCDRFTVRPTWKSRNCWLALLVIFALVFSANHWDSFNAALS